MTGNSPRTPEKRWWSPPPRIVAFYSLGLLCFSMFLLPLSSKPAFAIDIAWLVLTATLLWFRRNAGVWLYLMISVGLVLNGLRLLVFVGSSKSALTMLLGGIVAIPGFWVLRSALQSEKSNGTDHSDSRGSTTGTPPS